MAKTITEDTAGKNVTFDCKVSQQAVSFQIEVEPPSRPSPCFCDDVEQELLLFWRGDVEANNINGDGSKLLRMYPLMPKKKTPP